MGDLLRGVSFDPRAAQAATDWLEGLLVAIGAGRQSSSGKWQCPHHGRVEGHSAALAVDAGRSGALLHCHAGCDTDEVLAALALRREHLFTPPPMPPALHARARLGHVKFPPMRSVGTPAQRGFRFEAHHYYGPGHRKERLRHPVTREKSVSWETRDDRDAWGPGLRGVKERDLPLYREADLRPAIGAGEVIVLCESESSVDALTKTGIYATCWAGGASSPPARIRTVLGAANVVIVPDHDEAGLKCRDRLVELLPSARVVVGNEGEDARDLLDRLGADAFRTLLESPVADVEPELDPPTCPHCGEACTHDLTWPVWLCRPCREYQPDPAAACLCCNGPMSRAANNRWYCHPCRAYLDTDGEFTHTAGIELCDAHARYLVSHNLVIEESA